MLGYSPVVTSMQEAPALYERKRGRREEGKREVRQEGEEEKTEQEKKKEKSKAALLS